MRSVRAVCWFIILIMQAPCALAADDALQVKSVTPSGEVKDVRQIVIAFDRPVARLGESLTKAHLAQIDIKPTLQCQWRSLGLDRIACELPGEAAPSMSTEYVIKVLPGFQSVDGARTAKTVQYRFSTPRPGINYARLTHFDEPGVPVFELGSHHHKLIPQSLRRSLYFRDENGRKYPARLMPAAERRDSGYGWTVVPAAELPQGAGYSLVLDAGLKSYDGPLESAQEKILHRFKTYSEFRVAGIECAHAFNVEGKPEYSAYKPESSPPCLYNHVRMKFTTPVSPRRARAALDAPLKISRADFASSWMNDEVDLRGLLAPGRGNRLRLPATSGLKDQFGRPLSENFEITVQTSVLEENIFPAGGAVLEQGEATDLPLILTNVKTASIEGTLYYSAGAKSRAVPRYEFWQGSADNQWHLADTGIRKLFGRESGYFKGAATATSSGKTVPLHVQVTPFNIAAFPVASGYQVWVLRMADAVPVPGATVRIYSTQDGQPLRNARAKTFKTDSSGLVFIHNRDIEVPFFKDYNKAPRLVIEASHGRDSGFLSVSAGEWVHHHARERPLEVLRASLDSVLSVWTSFSQPLYQPGDTVRFKVYARELTRDGYRPPAAQGDWISIEHYGGGREGYVPGFERRKIAWSGFGTFNSEFELPQNAPHGAYMVMVGRGGADQVVDAGMFKVAEFNKQEFELELSADKTVLREGERATAVVTASLQNSGAYAGAPTRLRAKVEIGVHLGEVIGEQDTHGEYPELEGFYFQPAREDINDGPPLFDVSGSTDAQGGFAHSFVPRAGGVYYGKAIIKSAVEDARGKAVYQSRSLRYFAVDRLVGVKLSEDQVVAGELAEVHALAIDVAEKRPAAGVPVTLRIERDLLNRNVGDHYRSNRKYRWQALTSCKMRTAASTVACAFQPPGEGFYRVTAEIRDARGRAHASSRIEWIDMIPGKRATAPPAFELKVTERARVGGALEFSIESDAEAATALVSIQRNDILQTSVHSLKKGNNPFSIAVTSAMAPGVYLMVSIQRPRSGVPAITGPDGIDTAEPFLFHNHRLIKIEDAGSVIGLAVKPDRNTYAPGDSVKLTLDAKTAEPDTSVELSVAVVDQALLQLHRGDAERYYDVRSGFLFPYRSDFDFVSSGCHDLSSLLAGYGYRGPIDYHEAHPFFYRFDPACISNLQALQRISGVLMADIPGSYAVEEIQVYGIRGSIQEPVYARKDFRDLAFWLPAKTVTGGKPGTVEFRLPDNLTRWRVFVLAADRDARFGAAWADITTEKMIELRAALPNRLVEGDELDARFTILNRAPRARRLDYAAKAEGVLQAEAGADPAGALQAAPAQRAVVDFKVKAEGAGEGVLSFSAGDGVDRDALRTSIPVAPRFMPAGSYMRGEISGLNSEQAPLSIPLQLPANAVPDTGSFALSFNVSRLDDIHGALQYGRDYPYTCWEQTLSRAVLAAMYLRVPEYLRAQMHWTDPERLITETLAEAAGFQGHDGGMTFFGPGSGESSRYLSAYTLLAFSWLREWGYDTPAEVEAPLQGYLVKANDKKPRLQGDSTGLALPLLLRRGLIKPDVAGRILPSLEQSSTLEKVYRLALSPQLKGETAYSFLLEALDREAYQDPHGSSFPLASTAVAQCFLLSLLAGNPDFFKGQEDRIERLAGSTRRLLQGRGHWRNTQENVFCARALLDHDRYFNTERPDLSIRVDANGSSKSLELKGVKSGRQNPATLELDPGAPGSSMEISLSADGRGKAYYTARLAYARDMEGVAAESQGFAIRRSYKIRQDDNWVELRPDTVLQRGQLVRVDLTVWAPADRAMVAVVDPLPGNLEAMNPAFATSHTPHDEYEFLESDYGYADYIFYHRELGLQSVRFYAEHAPAGEYRLNYIAQVIAAGKFMAPPPIVEEMYAPEVYGRGVATLLFSR